jgi:hypothetical protein
LGKNKNQPKVFHLLESTNEAAIKEAKELASKQSKYAWALYSELAEQRERVLDNLKQSLLSNCLENYTFENWQRAIKYRYSLHPLCTLGSLSYIGGRFNIGDSINANVTPFTTLYIAENKDTALQEHLSQIEGISTELSSREVALNNPQSESILRLNGSLDLVIDLSHKDSILDFVNIIKKFTKSKYIDLLVEQARLNNPPQMIKSVDMLLNALLNKQWRIEAALYDVPSTSQIFGQIALMAGITGILYPSKFTGKNCLAIFTQNFKDSTSWIKIADETPDDSIILHELNRTNYEAAEWDRKKFLMFQKHENIQ